MRNSRWSWTFVVLAMCWGMSIGAQEAAAPPKQGPPTSHAGAPGVEPLDRLVTLDVHDVPIMQAIQAVDEQAGLGLAYSDQVLPVGKRVTVKLSRVPAHDALEKILTGTRVVVRRSVTGVLILAREQSKRAAADTGVVPSGWVGGFVTDSATTRPIANVLVNLVGKDTSASGVTNTDGWYALHIPAGQYVLHARYLGYAPDELTVMVADSQELRVDIALRMRTSRLQEVVTTATGDKRRLEVGNDITLIQADSIVATQPINSVTDLLEGRVPGLVVQRTSGAPGDPARLRLRGVSSPQLNNDPIVIVNGVRVYAAQSDKRSGNLANGLTTYAAPSPLDYIDPHSIETIEVLKGASATSLYGQDAANGVIVITTKRGANGPARWTMSAEHGRTVIPGRYPDMYLRWGHALAENTPIICPISNENGIMACEADSLVHFQILNDPRLSILAPGSRDGMFLGVSGGNGALLYAVNGNYSDELGQMQLPQYETDRFRTLHGIAPPSWMQRPQQLRRWGATNTLTARLGDRADASLTSSLSRTEQQRSSLENQLGDMMVTYLDRGTGTYYRAGLNGISPASDLLSAYYERATAKATEFTNGANVTWRVLPWLTTSATAGLNMVERADQILLPQGSNPQDTTGRLSLGRGSSMLSTVNLTATAQLPLALGVNLQLATGANYAGESVTDMTGGVTGLAKGTSSPDHAAEITGFNQQGADQATFGWFVEPSFHSKRWWFSTGFRMDGGSTYGGKAKLPIFPKLSLSYNLGDEPFFPKLSFLSTLRLRAAYGHAGRQPGPADRLRLFSASTPVWVGDHFADGVELQTLGNAQLRPERSKEFEAGFDADMLGDRLQLTFTGYRKLTVDALMQVPVAPSVYGSGATIWRNVGMVRNDGLDLTADLQLVRTDAVSFGMGFTLSKQRNLVLALGTGVEPFYITPDQRVASGYPLFGRWARPVLGYADANGDGVLEPDEVIIGDTAVYVGSSVPNYTTTIRPTLSLFRGAIAISAGFTYESGMAQMNELMRQMMFFAGARNDPQSSLAEQSLIVALGGLGAIPGGMTNYGLIRDVSVLRFNSLSVGYNVPAALARRLGARALTVSLQGTNLGLKTNYTGLDPDVNSSVSANGVIDTGTLPQPRTWQVRVSASY